MDVCLHNKKTQPNTTFPWWQFPSPFLLSFIFNNSFINDHSLPQTITRTFLQASYWPCHWHTKKHIAFSEGSAGYFLSRSATTIKTKQNLAHHIASRFNASWTVDMDIGLCVYWLCCCCWWGWLYVVAMVRIHSGLTCITCFPIRWREFWVLMSYLRRELVSTMLLWNKGTGFLGAGGSPAITRPLWLLPPATTLTRLAPLDCMCPWPIANLSTLV